MADFSRRGGGSLVAFLAGAVVMLTVMLVLFGWQGGQRLTEAALQAVRGAPQLPSIPRLPEAPHLPDVPVPKPL